MLILDDSGVPKKDEATQGVKRQYIGQLGKVANGQVFVTSHYAEQRCHWPVDLLPYVPDNWLEGGKADPAFRTKIKLTLELADRAVAWGLRFRAIVAEAWYGHNTGFIKGLEKRSLPYVVELEAAQGIFARLEGDIASNEHRLKEALSLVEPKDFRPVRLTAADGTERQVFVAALEVKIKKLTGKRRAYWALVECYRTEGGPHQGPHPISLGPTARRSQRQVRHRSRRHSNAGASLARISHMPVAPVYAGV